MVSLHVFKSCIFAAVHAVEAACHHSTAAEERGDDVRDQAVDFLLSSNSLCISTFRSANIFKLYSMPNSAKQYIASMIIFYTATFFPYPS